MSKSSFLSKREHFYGTYYNLKSKQQENIFLSWPVLCNNFYVFMLKLMWLMKKFYRFSLLRGLVDEFPKYNSQVQLFTYQPFGKLVNKERILLTSYRLLF